MSARPMALGFEQRPGRRLNGWVVVWLLAAAAGAGGLTLQGGKARDERDELSARHDLLEARLQPARVRGAEPDAETQHAIERANAVIDELAVPWGVLFRAIESADARGLGLLSLVPNAQDGTIRLSGEARSVPALLAYVDRVAAQPTLGQVHLLGYETVAREGASVVAFTLAAQWKRR